MNFRPAPALRARCPTCPTHTRGSYHQQHAKYTSQHRSIRFDFANSLFTTCRSTYFAKITAPPSRFEIHPNACHHAHFSRHMPALIRPGYRADDASFMGSQIHPRQSVGYTGKKYGPTTTRNSLAGTDGHCHSDKWAMLRPCIASVFVIHHGKLQVIQVQLGCTSHPSSGPSKIEKD